MDLLLTLHGGDEGVREVRLAKKAHDSLSARISTLAARFLNDDTEQHAYAPGFRPDEGVVALPLGLPEVLWRCRLSLPKGVPRLDEASLKRASPLALVSIDVGRNPRFIFQVIDSRNVLNEGRVLLFAPGAFAFNDQPGVIIPDRVDAVHKNGILYFTSEHTVRRFLDLGDIFREATDDEIDSLFSNTVFAVDDMDAIKAAASTPMRRKLHAISQAARVFSSDQLRKVASELNITLTLRKNAIVVPPDAKGLRDFVRLLDDDYLRSMLDEEQVYLTTSKRPV